MMANPRPRAKEKEVEAVMDKSFHLEAKIGRVWCAFGTFPTLHEATATARLSVEPAYIWRVKDSVGKVIVP